MVLYICVQNGLYLKKYASLRVTIHAICYISFHMVSIFKTEILKNSSASEAQRLCQGFTLAWTQLEEFNPLP